MYRICSLIAGELDGKVATSFVIYHLLLTLRVVCLSCFLFNHVLIIDLAKSCLGFIVLSLSSKHDESQKAFATEELCSLLGCQRHPLPHLIIALLPLTGLI